MKNNVLFLLMVLCLGCVKPTARRPIHSKPSTNLLTIYTKENKKLNEKLSNALIELLKPNSIHGLNNLRKLLQDKTGEVIGDKKMDRILLICKDNIGVHKTENGVGNIYSYTE